MAFTASSLICIGGGSGQRLWYYSTADTIATVNTAGYFNSAANMLNLNDVIMTVTSTGATPVVGHTYVNGNNGSTVDIVDGVAIASTDGD